MKPEWYKKSELRRLRLPNNPEQNGCLRAMDIVRGLRGKYRYGLVAMKFEGDYQTDRLRKDISKGMYDLVRIVPCGSHFRAVLAITELHVRNEIEQIQKRLTKLEGMLQ